MDKFNNGHECYTFKNGDWGKLEENNGSSGVGRWRKAATGGGWWRQWAALDGGSGPKQREQGKAEEAEQGTADGGAAGRRRVRQWRRRVPTVRLGDSRSSAPVTGGDERRRRQKKQAKERGGYTGLGSRGREMREMFGFIFFIYFFGLILFSWLLSILANSPFSCFACEWLPFPYL